MVDVLLQDSPEVRSLVYLIPGIPQSYTNPRYYEYALINT